MNWKRIPDNSVYNGEHSIRSSSDHSNRCRTRDRNTIRRSTRDHNNRCVRNTSNRYPSSNPSKGYPRTGHHTVSSSEDVLHDGNGTDDVSDCNLRWRRCSLPYRLRHHNMNRSARECLHIWCHVYIWWEHRPDRFRPHTGSDWFRRYNGGYTHRDHGQL